jgi:hypothetical protein
MKEAALSGGFLFCISCKIGTGYNENFMHFYSVTF